MARNSESSYAGTDDTSCALSSFDNAQRESDVWIGARGEKTSQTEGRRSRYQFTLVNALANGNIRGST